KPGMVETNFTGGRYRGDKQAADSEEREVFENQEGMHRLIPLIEAQTEEDLTPTMREYFAQIREYRKNR
ncbi:hypothetical protein NE600_27005, partial [Bacteroides thetaiotaomicron]|nr:hypothetical protein [Bacteroides thetaiotaomicron]